MRATFSGLEIAKTGLFISQKGIDVTGHNIANVNTPGYTRQRLITQAIAPSGSFMRLHDMDRGKVGTGVEVMILDQVRDKFLDSQFRQQNTSSNTWSYRTQGLSYLEGLFDERSESSLTVCIDDFFNSLYEFAKNPSDKELRANARQQAIKMTENFAYVHNRLVDQINNQNTCIDTITKQINTIAGQIADLNANIARYELSGEQANDLRDQRNLLLDELSGLVDITYSNDSDDYLTIKVGGQDLVNHVTVTPIDITYSANPYTGENDWCTLTLGGMDLDTSTLKGGQLYAHLNLRDNDTSNTPGIPYFLNLLGDLAVQIADLVNGVHEQGYTYPDDENGNLSQTGIPFFAPCTNAGDFRVSDEVMASVFNMAGSSSPIDLTADSPQTGNQETALALADLIKTGGIYDNLNSIVLELAVTLQHSKNMANTQATMVESIDNQRLSVSGVSMDEELTNLIRYQHAYQGAARVITAMDEALDVLINRMGRVGLS